eukprot:scaffold3181_cov13-Tisochrysis_lutea.AAC.1
MSDVFINRNAICELSNRETTRHSQQHTVLKRIRQFLAQEPPTCICSSTSLKRRYGRGRERRCGTPVDDRGLVRTSGSTCKSENGDGDDNKNNDDSDHDDEDEDVVRKIVLSNDVA